MTTTLETVAGLQTRIFALPGRPPFMLSVDMALAYRTTVKAINQAVKRNPARFPERYTFVLTEAQFSALRSQNVTANAEWSKVRFEPRGFTHGGANMLSSVLKGDVADRMAVAINDAFTEMEQAAIRDAKSQVARIQVEALRKKPIFAFIQIGMQRAMSLDEMWRQSNYPKWKLEQAARDMLAMKLIARLPDGMTGDLFDA